MTPSLLRRVSGFAALRVIGFTASVGFLAAGCPASTATPADGGGGGTGGSGPPICTASDDDLISDFTMDSGVHQVDGRMGGWYTYGDRSGFGVLDPAEGGTATPDLTTGNTDCSGSGSLHVTAMTFTDWGAAFGTDFMPKVPDAMSMMVKGPYDASKYKGIAFWAKATKPIKFVQVKFTDPYTEPSSILATDQRCFFTSDPALKPTKNCSPYIVKFGYGNETDATVAADFPAYKNYKIDTTWKRFTVMFADTKQDQYNLGQQSPGNKLDVAQIMGMAIQVNSDPPTANDFEIWVDDVSFIK